MKRKIEPIFAKEIVLIQKTSQQRCTLSLISALLTFIQNILRTQGEEGNLVNQQEGEAEKAGWTSTEKEREKKMRFVQQLYCRSTFALMKGEGERVKDKKEARAKQEEEMEIETGSK